MAKCITGKTKLIGLLAHPAAHSLSPIMHNEAFARLGLDYVYLAFDCNNDQLPDVVKGFRSLKIRGFNVSMPNKTLICMYLDKLSPGAELAGAVNTVVNDNGILTGHNTDGTGYMNSLKEQGINIIGQKMTLIGAGGAGTAISIQAALDGVKEISVFNVMDQANLRAQHTIRDINEKTHCKARLFDLADINSLRKELSDSAILTDATSVGMKPLENLCNIPDPAMLRPDLVVTDVVYSPRKTNLLVLAEKQGCKIMNGMGMVLWQGAEAFKIWTGHEMPVDYIKRILF